MPKKIRISLERVRGRVPKRNPDLITIVGIPYIAHVTGAGRMTGQEYASEHERAFRYALAFRLFPNQTPAKNPNQIPPIPDRMSITYNYK